MTRARDVANLIGSGNYSSTTFTATAGQTAFTISHTQGFVQVFMNGLLLDETVDYTSNGSAVTLTSGAAAGDEIEVVAYNTFSVGDALPKSGGTMSGALTVDAAAATVLTVDRATSDGTIIDVQKDGTSVGSIGSYTDRIYLSTSGNGLTIDESAARVIPSDGSGSNRDAAIDLGQNNGRWKDLYLSGGAYIGGIGTANYLDDYEEGEYTPLLYGYTTGSGTLLPLRSTHNTLSYTKIGRKVTVNGKIETSGSHSAQGSLLLSIPFTGANLTDQAGQGAGSCFFYRTGQLHENPTVIFGEGVDYVYFFSNTSGGDVLGITADVMDTAIELIVGFTYFTT